MKILFTIYDLQNYGGTETFSYSIMHELIKKGNMVFCYSSRLGKAAERLRDIGVFVTDDLNSLPQDIDVIHAQHRMEALLAYIRFPKVPMLFVSHGIIPWQEQPIKLPSIHKYIAVSEEISAHLQKNHNIPSESIDIIRNGIDTTRFTPSKINDEPKEVLLVSNRYTDEVKMVLEKTCEMLGATLHIVGLSGQVTWEVENEIAKADIVVSLGRGILEAMASGKIALIYDYNGGDGIVTPENYDNIKLKNFSGRTHRIKYDHLILFEEIKRNYNSHIVEGNIRIISENHDIVNITNRFYSVYMDAIKQTSILDVQLDDFILQSIHASYKNVGKEFIQKEKNTKYLLDLLQMKEQEMESMENKSNNQLTSLKAEYNVSQNQIVELSKALEEENANLNRLLEEKILMEQTLSALNEEMKRLNQIIEDKERENTQKENNSQYLLELNNEKDTQLNLIQNSKAWKAVSKYRYVKQKVNKAIKDPRWAFSRLLGRNQDIPRPKNVFANKPEQHSVSGKPLVSVVIPIYDRTDVLIESIDSILKQSYENIELLLVCDGSPQPTIDIVKSYESHPKVRVFYFYNNSGNAVRGRNKAIVESRGKYIAFQDSDDIAEVDRLEISVKYMEEFQADVVYGGWRALVDGSRQIDIRNGEEIFSPDCDYEMLSKICVPCQSTVMAKLEALRSVGGLKTSMKYREDHELWLRLAYNGYTFKSIPRILTNLRLHGNNLELQFKDTDNKWFDLMLEEHKKISRLKPKIAYVIPGCGISGGIAVICQHANRLLARGYDVILVTEDDKKSIDWFPDQKVQVMSLEECPDNIEILVATGWSTAYTVAQLPSQRKIYFVQSDESRFYPENSLEYKKALKSYEFEFEYMTEAKWIQRWLRDSYNKTASYVPNGLDEKIIHPTPPIIPKQNKLRVLLEGPIDIPFKGMQDAFEAVKDLDCEIWCISSAGRPRPEWRCDRFFEKVPMENMKQIYSSCDILLKMSRVEGFFGPPLEMMACGGTCVVGEVTGYDEYIINEHNALVVKLGDVEGAKRAVQRLLEDEQLRFKLIENGKKTADQWKWEPTIDELENIINRADNA